MAPASIAISLPFRLLLPPRPSRGRASWTRAIRATASGDTSGVAGGERKVGALERRAGDLRALVASVPPAVASIRRNIGPNFVAGFCLGIAVLAAGARQVIIRSRERDSKGSVADLVRRGQLKSGQRGTLPDSLRILDHRGYLASHLGIFRAQNLAQSRTKIDK